MTAQPIIITLDGPSGSGKGTISQLVAKHFNLHLLDSGSLYRLTALAALNNNIALDNDEQLSAVATNLDVRFEMASDRVMILLAGEDVSNTIRSEPIGMAASQVAKLPGVRQGLLSRQRSFAQMPGLVADGRDMGTTVFPDASFKFFLTASAEARADRRCAQLAEKGFEFDWNDVVKDIRERDERDTTRAVSPLRPADDAIIIDSTSMPIDVVLKRVIDAVNQ